jgi:hypothetical protein
VSDGRKACEQLRRLLVLRELLSTKRSSETAGVLEFDWDFIESVL